MFKESHRVKPTVVWISVRVTIKNGEAESDGQESKSLCALVEPEVPLARHLDAVIDESNEAGPGDGQHHEDSSAGENAVVEQVADHVANHSPTHDGCSTHRRGARFGLVTVRPVIANRLADPVTCQPLDEELRTDE
jgi:hypothetical protein